MPPPSNPLDRSTEITRSEAITILLEELGKLIRNLEKVAHKALTRPDNLSIDTLRDSLSQFLYQFNRWAKVSFPDVDRVDVLTPPAPHRLQPQLRPAPPPVPSLRASPRKKARDYHRQLSLPLLPLGGNQDCMRQRLLIETYTVLPDHVPTVSLAFALLANCTPQLLKAALTVHFGRHLLQLATTKRSVSVRWSSVAKKLGVSVASKHDAAFAEFLRSVASREDGVVAPEEGDIKIASRLLILLLVFGENIVASEEPLRPLTRFLHERHGTKGVPEARQLWQLQEDFYDIVSCVTAARSRRLREAKLQPLGASEWATINTLDRGEARFQLEDFSIGLGLDSTFVEPTHPFPLKMSLDRRRF